MDEMQAPVMVQSAQAATVRVNGVVIDKSGIAGERAYHEGEPDTDSAARRALVIRELLRQHAASNRSGVLPTSALSFCFPYPHRKTVPTISANDKQDRPILQEPFS